MTKAMQSVPSRIKPHAGQPRLEEWNEVRLYHGSPSPGIGGKVEYWCVLSAGVRAVHLSEAIQSSYGAELRRSSGSERDLLHSLTKLDGFRLKDGDHQTTINTMNFVPGKDLEIVNLGSGLGYEIGRSDHGEV